LIYLDCRFHAGKPPILFGIKKITPKVFVVFKWRVIPNTMALETQADYVNRMIMTIQYFTNIGYYTEASFLNKTNAENCY
jgi:hypothetical protein